MKLRTYKCIGFLIAAFLISSLQAQKFDKKFNETFKVNKDVLLAINASNADIKVSTWNRNEVAVNAVITVDGLSKKEAQKFLKNWKFEALGNKSKVQINANANRFLHVGDNDFRFNLDFDNITIPELNIDIPELNFDFDNIVIPEMNIDIPEFNFDFGDLMIDIPTIKIPEINLDFDSIWSEIENHDFNDGDKQTFTFQSKGKKKKVVIKSKKEWEAFKKTKDYQELKKDLRKSLKEAQVKLQSIDSKKIKEEIKKAQASIQKIDKKKIQEELRKAKLKYEKVDKVKIKESLDAARKTIEKMKMKMAKNYKNGNNVIIVEDGDSKKKVRITRKITIKVPRNATFDLNTRHSKVKLPKGKTSGKVSYGAFNADELIGEDLKIDFAPVNIKALSGGTVTLNNITDAAIASVINTNLTSNSTGLKVNRVGNNVTILSKFGDLLVSEMSSNLKNLKLNLSFTEAVIALKNLKERLKFSQVDNIENTKSNDVVLNGNFTAGNSQVKIKGKQSKLTIKKD